MSELLIIAGLVAWNATGLLLVLSGACERRPTRVWVGLGLLLACVGLFVAILP